MIASFVGTAETEFSKSKYTKLVSINNHLTAMYGIIDTGCDICLIRKNTAQQYELVIQFTTQKLTVHSNSKSNVICGVTNASSQISHVTEHIQLWVVEDEAQKYDLLIGTAFTDKNSVTFVKTNTDVNLIIILNFHSQKKTV